MHGDGGNDPLEEVFSVLRFRRRGPVSFRKFIILSASEANALRSPEGETQPLRVLQS
jgi:hypothetical protein